MTVLRPFVQRLTARGWARTPGSPAAGRRTIRLDRRASTVLIIWALALTAALSYGATRFQLQVPALLVIAAPLFLLACIRWPLLALYAFAALIPLEERVRYAISRSAPAHLRPVASVANSPA